MESLKKLLKTDQFKEISSNNEILREVRLSLIKMNHQKSDYRNNN